MARYAGRDLVTVWAYTGGSVDLSADFRNLAEAEDVEDADATAGDDTYSNHLPTFTDATIDFEMLDNDSSAGTLAWSLLAPRTEGTIHYWPRGTASGKPYTYAPAYIQHRDREFPYDDVVPVKVTFQLTAEPTEGAVA